MKFFFSSRKDAKIAGKETGRVTGPLGVAVDNAGSLLIADGLGTRIRKVSSDGSIATVAGTLLRRRRAVFYSSLLCATGGTLIEFE